MSEEFNMQDQVINMLEMAGLYAKECMIAMMSDVVKEMSSNEDFVKGVVMVAAFLLLISQIYLYLRRGQQLSRETLVGGIKESTDEVVEDFNRMTNDVKDLLKLRNWTEL